MAHKKGGSDPRDCFKYPLHIITWHDKNDNVTTKMPKANVAQNFEKTKTEIRTQATAKNIQKTK